MTSAAERQTPSTEAAHAEAAAAVRPLLRVRDLAVSFPARLSDRPLPAAARARAVDGASFTIHPRQTLAVVGESGCGKSVTALAVLGLVPPPGLIERGSIELGGRELRSLTRRQMLAVRGGEIAMIFQEPMTSLNPVFTVGDQIIEAIRLHQRDVDPRDMRARAIQAMHDVGIANAAQRVSAYPHQLSGGMRQRVMIAMALACQPRLLLADEPTTALDVTIQAQILELLGALQRRPGADGMGVMLITHDLGVVAQNADVVCVMYAGRVVEYADVFALFERPLHPYTRALLRCKPRLDAEARARLATVADIMGDAVRLQSLATDVEPWWPSSLASAAFQSEERAGYALLEVEPSHWVGCVQVDGAPTIQCAVPDLDFRRDRADDYNHLPLHSGDRHASA